MHLYLLRLCFEYVYHSRMVCRNDVVAFGLLHDVAVSPIRYHAPQLEVLLLDFSGPFERDHDVAQVFAQGYYVSIDLLDNVLQRHVLSYDRFTRRGD